VNSALGLAIASVANQPDNSTAKRASALTTILAKAKSSVDEIELRVAALLGDKIYRLLH